MHENPTNPYDLKLDTHCNHEGCKMPGKNALCVQFFMPGDDLPTTRFFPFPVCDFHKWPKEAVSAFLEDNWDEITQGFGLGALPDKDNVIFAWVPWWRAVEFWRKLQVAKEKTQKEAVH